MQQKETRFAILDNGIYQIDDKSLTEEEFKKLQSLMVGFELFVIEIIDKHEQVKNFNK